MVTAVATEVMPPPPPMEGCACCGRRDVGMHVRLHCRPETAICDRCLLWLNARWARETYSRIARRIGQRLRAEQAAAPGVELH